QPGLGELGLLHHRGSLQAPHPQPRARRHRRLRGLEGAGGRAERHRRDVGEVARLHADRPGDRGRARELRRGDQLAALAGVQALQGERHLGRPRLPQRLPRPWARGRRGRERAGERGRPAQARVPGPGRRPGVDTMASGLPGQLGRADLCVLVAEPLADAGVALLRQHVAVDSGVGWSAEELADRIGGYDGIVVRSATKVTADLIDRGARLKVIGRAGTGVDNVDVDAATRRGIIVCNAPDANSLSAAEHTIALILAQARNVPQAHARLVDGKWERSKFGGIEVTGKTLGVVGLGRIGQMVAERARGLRMRVIAYDPYVAEGRFRELGVERADTLDELLATSDVVTLHMPATNETRGMIDAAALARMRPGARLVNVARGDLVDEAALADALRSGHLAGAAVDVFPSEPATESPLFGLPGVVVTPHLGASTVEAQDRAGAAVAEQVAAALTGGLVTTAVNIPAVSPESLEVLGPLLPLARQLGQLVAAICGGRRRPPLPARAGLRGAGGGPRHPPPDHRRPRRHPPRPRGGGGEPGQRRQSGRRARHRVDDHDLAARPGLHEPDHGPRRRRLL